MTNHLLSTAARSATFGRRDFVESGRAILGECGLFRRLSDSERETLFARARTQRYAPNESIFLMGSPGDSMVAVLSGTIRISVPSVVGKEIVLAILGPGEICGEIALLDGKERAADARAATECSVVVLERRDVLAFLSQYPAAWPKLIDVLCERLRTTDQQVAEFALSAVPVRLAKALLRLATSDDQPLNGRTGRRVHLTQRELGNIIGATRESVNKYLRAWQRKGYVRIADRLIVITNRAAMEDLTDPED
jgi:CRP/FNR family transcriptional regulator, cyclic AMP receptor protein